MDETSPIHRQVVDHILKMAGPRNARSQVSSETEIYGDLGIYGMELYDLVIWIIEEFGVATNIDIDQFAPPEGGLPFLAEWERQRSRGRYKSFKVRDIMAAIEAGRWQPPVAVDESLRLPSRVSFLKFLSRLLFR